MVTKDASRSFIYSFGIDFKSIHWFSFMPKYFNKILLQINEWNRNKETSNKKFTWKSYFYFNIDSSFLAFCLVDFWMDFISLVEKHLRAFELVSEGFARTLTSYPLYNQYFNEHYASTKIHIVFVIFSSKMSVFLAGIDITFIGSVQG